MSLAELTEAFSWTRYSKKLAARIERPRCFGIFTETDAQARGMRFAEAEAGSVEEGNRVHFYWLVDPEDGVVVDVKFQAWGQTALNGAAEAACELLAGKNYDQAKRLNPEAIDQHLRDKKDGQAFPDETLGHLELVVEAIVACCKQCTDIPLEASYAPPPTPVTGALEGAQEYPGWQELNTEQKVSVIENVLDADIRPYIEMDDGGIKVLRLLNDTEVIIAYQGACTTCFSAVGATLSAIQQTLQTKIHPSLVVVPDSDSLQF